MKNMLVTMGRIVAIWAALLIGNIVAGMAVPLPPQPPGDGPLTAGAALLIIDLASALVLAALAARMAGSFVRRAATLFIVLFVVETLLSHIEALFFGDYLQLPTGLLAGVAAINAAKSLAGALVAAWVWSSSRAPDPLPAGLWWRLTAVAALYILCYFAAGSLIAWQSAAVRAYYGDGLDIDNGALALLQVVRGTIWAGIVLLIAAATSAPIGRKAMLAGVAFAVFMAGGLLYPNGFMPWAVRRVHLAEIGLSNLLFGIAAMFLLAGGKRLDRKIRQDARTASA